MQDILKNRLNLRMLIGLYCALFFLAPCVFYFGWTTSMTIGTIGVLVIWSIIHILLNLDKFFFNMRNTILFYFVATFLILHFLVTFFYFQYSANFQRGIFSLLIFLFFIACSFQFSRCFYGLSDRQVDYFMKVVFCINLIIFLLSLIKPLQPKYHKSIFPYTEASHFALFFVGCLYYMVVRYKKYRIVLLAFSLSIALIVKNLTLLVAVIFLAFCVFKFWIVFIGLLSSILIYSFLDLSYFTDRVENISSDSSNLSTLVFVQGWELALDGLKRSSGLGIGIQQLGDIKLDSRASRFIYLLTNKSLNITDAGLTAPKIICEFGVFGIAAIGFYLFILVKGILYMRKYEQDKCSNTKLMAYCFIVSFFTELFVRGVGYFIGTFFMVIASLLYICYCEKNSIYKKVEL